MSSFIHPYFQDSVYTDAIKNQKLNNSYILNLNDKFKKASNLNKTAGQHSFQSVLNESITENSSAAVSPQNNASLKEYARQRFQNPMMGQFLADRGISSSMIVDNFSIKNEIEKSPKHKKLMNACEELESLFLKLMLNSMKKNIQKAKFIDGGRTEEIFEDLLYDEYSKTMAKEENFGLAENIYMQFRHRL
jgi:hypothetical protein